ncbi:unnamed protein product [Paramecium sonneborni]|uniref:Uncharacterized protein n=1 Tax=Paramecium sonneborni TaxID=65129 RepID=A0A8S1RCZ4_9CILI|nr:unnamed protein product [Paramecium sonneborni]
MHGLHKFSFNQQVSLHQVHIVVEEHALQLLGHISHKQVDGFFTQPILHAQYQHTLHNLQQLLNRFNMAQHILNNHFHSFRNLVYKYRNLRNKPHIINIHLDNNLLNNIFQITPIENSAQYYQDKDVVLSHSIFLLELMSFKDFINRITNQNFILKFLNYFFNSEFSSCREF